MNHPDERIPRKRKMEDFDTPGTTSARQAVGLFASTPLKVPDREDVEIAASLLHGDDPSFMELFDAACWVRSLAAGSSERPMIGTSFSKVRAFAADRLEAGDVATLERKVGGRLSEECVRRLHAARDDAALRRHHLASAADHYAADVIDALSSLIGRPAEGFSLTAVPEFEMSSLLDLPFVCFLHPASTEVAHA